MRKILLWGGRVIASLLTLFVILSLLLYFPPFQRWAVQRVASTASERTGMQITVEKVRLAFPLDLSVEGIQALQPRPQSTVVDTVAVVKRAVVGVRLWPLLHSEARISALDLQGLKINTLQLIPVARIKGWVERLLLTGEGQAQWNEQLAQVPHLTLQGAQLDIALSDSVPPDTTPSNNKWRVAANILEVQRSRLVLHTVGDSMRLTTVMGNTRAEGVTMDLGKGAYTLRSLRWQNGALQVHKPFVATQRGLDPAHLTFSNLALVAEQLHYDPKFLALNLRHLALRERSGLTINTLRGSIRMDTAQVSVKQLYGATPYSHWKGEIKMALNALADSAPGQMNLRTDMSLGAADILLLAPTLPSSVQKHWPTRPLLLSLHMRGNMEQAHIHAFRLTLPGSFDLHTTGRVAQLLQPQHLVAQLQVKAQAPNLQWVQTLMPPSVRSTIRVPKGVGLKGQIHMKGAQVALNLTATQGGGQLATKAKVNTQTMTYTAQAQAKRFPAAHFVRGIRLTPITGSLTAHGQGTDFLSPRTQLAAKLKINALTAEGLPLHNTQVQAQLRKGTLQASLHSNSNWLQGTVRVNALTRQRQIRATMETDVARLDLHQMGWVSSPLIIALCGHIDVKSDLKQQHYLLADLTDLNIADKQHSLRPEGLRLELLSRSDTLHASLSSGDLDAKIDVRGGHQSMLKKMKLLASELQRQAEERYIDQPRLRRYLPQLTMSMHAKTQNVVMQLLRPLGYTAQQVDMALTTAPTTGLNGHLLMETVMADSIQLDTVKIHLTSDSVTTYYTAQVKNGKGNPNYAFNALLTGSIEPKGTSVLAKVFDSADKLGLRIGLRAEMEHGGVAFHMDPSPILGYKDFTVNDSNYVFLRQDKRVSALVDLRAADGTGMQVYSNDADSTALQDITVALHHFNIGRLMALLPYTPRIDGTLDGDFHIVKSRENLSMASSLSIEQLVYEGWNMGNVASEFTYIPLTDGSHAVEGTLQSNGREVASFDGTYQQAGAGHINAMLKMNQLPLDMINGFIPDRIMGLKGRADGTLSVRGTLKTPQVDGELFLDSASIYSEPYGVEMRFANDPVRIDGSKLLFENFEMFSHNEQPLNVQGSFDFSNLDNMMLDVRMRARNFLLVDAKETLRSEAYGKAFVNFYGTLKGALDKLQLRGRMDVLGATELKYNLKDSPLNTDNQLNELVQFTDFRDTVPDVVIRPQLSGLDMDLTLGIDEGAHVDCYLNANHSNYINVSGGGTLRLQYNNVDHMQLRGRYTIAEGEMKYSLPVIPLKTFAIEPGSYLEWRGDPMNPTLSLAANEDAKAAVGGGTGAGRLVLFRCGVKVSQTLTKMGLEFTIDAPEDITIHNQLQAMTREERGKLAVTMLTTGMYLADGNTSQFTMNSALSAFLNSQINQISNSALRSLDISFGMDNTTDATGAIHTDYSFKFAKRFWNNRLRISIGGKLSSGADVGEQQQTFFDNVTFEYRLSDTSSQYLNLFYIRDSYDWLEGNISKFGGGFTWKRKVRTFRDLFRLRDASDVPPVDTLSQPKTTPKTVSQDQP